MIIMINSWIKDQTHTQNKSLYKENEAFFMEIQTDIEMMNVFFSVQAC